MSLGFKRLIAMLTMSMMIRKYCITELGKATVFWAVMLRNILVERNISEVISASIFKYREK